MIIREYEEKNSTRYRYGGGYQDEQEERQPGSWKKFDLFRRAEVRLVQTSRLKVGAKMDGFVTALLQHTTGRGWDRLSIRDRQECWQS